MGWGHCVCARLFLLCGMCADVAVGGIWKWETRGCGESVGVGVEEEEWMCLMCGWMERWMMERWMMG